MPTLRMFADVDQAIATGCYHWFFLVQPEGLPEKMIGFDPDFYLREKLRRWSADPSAFAREAVAEYARCFRDPATIHVTCEDYRAAASIDLEHDRADLDREVACPVLALWGESGLMERHFDVPGTWRERCARVRGRRLACGHFLAEEAPRETLEALAAFLGGDHDEA